MMWRIVRGRFGMAVATMNNVHRRCTGAIRLGDRDRPFWVVEVGGVIKMFLLG